MRTSEVMALNKRFFIIAFISLLFWLVLYVVLFFFQIGNAVKAEWWIPDVCEYKDYLASQGKREKIIIAAGSNGLFGIDSTVAKIRIV